MLPEHRLEAWQCAISCAVSEADPVLCNLLITQAHDDLSRALGATLGADAGANFHTWAVWGSKKAGETIRFEDTQRFRRTTAGVSALAGLTLFSIAVAIGGSAVIAGGAVLAAVAAGVPPWLVRQRLLQTRAAVLEGNRIVLDDIGAVTARYVSWFAGGTEPAGGFDQFASTLRPGRTEAGGQAMLKRAFMYYDEARLATDLDRKHEATLMANCYAILHEHLRLQPYIAKAMPTGWRRWLTSNDLRFRLGPTTLQVSADVPHVDGRAFPETLQVLELPELVAFMRGMGGWDRTPDTIAGSQAADWASLEDRMNFIVDLFRSRHLTAELWSAPFPEAQTEAIRRIGAARLAQP